MKDKKGKVSSNVANYNLLSLLYIELNINIFYTIYKMVYTMRLLHNDNIVSSSYMFQIAIYYNMWCYAYEYVSMLERKYKLLENIPKEKHLEAKTRIISSCHAIILSFLSVCYLSKMIHFNTWTICLPISGAFGLFDLTMITLNYETFKKGYFATSTHHLCLIFGPLFISLDNSKLCSQGYLFEITVPILDASWYLYNANMANNLLFKFNTILSIFLFFFFRVLNSAYLTYQVTNENIIFFISCWFFALNVYWFKKLICVVKKSIQ